MGKIKKGASQTPLKANTITFNPSKLYSENSENSSTYSVSQVLAMKNSEGLIVDNHNNEYEQILNLLLDEEIIKDSKAFKPPIFFNDGTPKALFLFNKERCKNSLNIGRLAAWRIHTHDFFNGTWLTDYIENYTGA